MNKISSKFLLTRDKFIPELHLKQPGFIYSGCGSSSKHRQRIKKFRGNSVATLNDKLAEESHKPVIKNFERRKIYAKFKDNIGVVDLVEIE